MAILFVTVHFRSAGSTGLCLQSDTNLSSIIFGEANAGVLKRFLYFQDSREISFHDSFLLFNALQGCQAHPGPACKLDLAPA
jgi:hypothetical protein